MNASLDSGSSLHASRRRFQRVLQYTADQTGFGVQMVEKDYYCSLALHDLSLVSKGYLIFKGGTCLSKVHAGFHRLSEDLDFLLSVPGSLSRNERRKRIKPMRERLETLDARLPCFQLKEQMRGHDNSKQYIGRLSYGSVTGGEGEVILEASLREPALCPVIVGQAQTLLLDPDTGNAHVRGFPVEALSYHETYAEKFRAALSRRQPAIRDIYDIWVALSAGLKISDPAFVDLVRKKMAVSENSFIAMDDATLQGLREQLDNRLRPVVKPADYERFDFEGTMARLRRFAEANSFLQRR